MERNKLLAFLRNRVVVALFLVIVLLVCGPIFRLISGKATQWHRQRYGVPPGVRVVNYAIGGLYLDEVRQLLCKEAEQLVQWPVPAVIDNKGIVTPEIWGRLIDVDATMERIALAQPGDQIDPVYGMIKPILLSNEIASLRKTLGLFYTIVGGTEDRLENIRVGGKLINYALVMPGQIFSFNKALGPPIPERGFKKAPVIVGEDFVPGYGGGLCQVSTTLYNAVLKAGLKVIERYPHSQQINYVPPGKDAAVAYDYLDFKFQNTTKHPILVRVWVWGRRLQVAIYGPDL